MATWSLTLSLFSPATLGVVVKNVLSHLLVKIRGLSQRVKYGEKLLAEMLTDEKNKTWDSSSNNKKGVIDLRCISRVFTAAPFGLLEPRRIDFVFVLYSVKGTCYAFWNPICSSYFIIGVGHECAIFKGCTWRCLWTFNMFRAAFGSEMQIPTVQPLHAERVITNNCHTSVSGNAYLKKGELPNVPLS